MTPLRRAWGAVVSGALLTALVLAPALTSSNAAYTAATSTTVINQMGVLNAPSEVKAVRAGTGSAVVTWKAPTSGVTVGSYIVKRAEGSATAAYVEVGRTDPATLTFTDGGAAGSTKTFFYQVTAVRGGWTSGGYDPNGAPPPVGNDFFDSFTSPSATLSGRPTEDGKSNWLVWGGDLEARAYTGAEVSLKGKGVVYAKTTARSIGVVRTITHEASIYAADIDGFEGIVLRGSDPSNYLLVTSSNRVLNSTTGNTQLLRFQKVENGVVGDLAVLPAPIPENLNVRVVTEGTKLSVYKVSDQNTSVVGLTPLLTTNTDFNLANPNATYFGFSITGNIGFLVDDFYFQGK